MQIQKISNFNNNDKNISFRRGYIYKPQQWPANILESYVNSSGIRNLIKHFHSKGTDLLASFSMNPGRYYGVDICTFNTANEKEVVSLMSETTKALEDKLKYMTNADEIIKNFAKKNKKPDRLMSLRKTEAMDILKDFNKSLSK